MARKMRSKKSKINLSRKNNPFYGKHHTAAWKRAEHRRKKGKNNPMHGRKHRPSTIRKIRQAALRRSVK